MESTGSARWPEVVAVRLAGGIQAHGFLLGVDPVTGVIEVVSENLADFVPVDPAAALGASLTEVLGAPVVQQLPQALPLCGDLPVQRVRLPAVAAAGGAASPGVATATGAGAGQEDRRSRWQEFEVVGHHCGPLWVWEFEPTVGEQVTLGALHDSFRRTLDRLRSEDGVAELCAVAVTELRALTGYDRVLVYRFDDHFHGEVIAEARRADLDPYQGLTFAPPAIPPRTRSLYRRGWLRLVANLHNQPVGLLGAAGSAASAGFDPTASMLRSEFDTDRAYVDALGIAALMTIPIVIDDQLWGLLTCHHQTPRRVSHHVRDSSEVLGRVVSLQIRAANLRVEQARATRLDGLAAAVVTAMEHAEWPDLGMAGVSDALLGMVAADGAVFEVDGHRVTTGRIPAGAGIDGLVARVAELAGGHPTPWATDALPGLLPPREGWALPGGATVTGVLYLTFGGSAGGYGLWLRTEQIHTVSWARGPDHVTTTIPTNPTVPTSPASDDPVSGETAAVRPRSWVTRREEMVLGHSRPWLNAERGAAATLARALPAVLLRRTQRLFTDQQLLAAADRLRAASAQADLEQRLHQNQRLESLGQLAGGVAHDFNNLLAVITTYLEFIGDAVDTRAAFDPAWGDVQTDVTHVKTATRRAGDLTHQLLAFARREVVQPRPLNLNHILTGLEPLLRRTLGQRFDVRIDPAPTLPLVLADPGHLEQILVNLAVNARDAMPTGGTLTIDTTDLSYPAPLSGGDGRCVRLRVTDTGAGIPPDIIDRVFDPFFTTKARGQGTGLGLATVHGLITQIGGLVDIDSTPGRGTTFTVLLPTTDIPAPDTVAAPTANPPGRGGGATVLLVEDGDDLRAVADRILTAAGYTVLTAADGPGALTAAAAHEGPIDLLLTDLVMPVMTGDEVAARVRRLRPDIAVLLMSGYAEPVLGPDGAVLAVDPVLNKPFTRAQLLHAVRDVLDPAHTTYDNPPLGQRHPQPGAAPSGPAGRGLRRADRAVAARDRASSPAPAGDPNPATSG